VSDAPRSDVGHPLAEAAGIHAMPLPTPFPVGDINAWLIDDEPLTLVDTGPSTAEALVAVERGLAAHGRRIEDLERILLTHEHADHVGLTAILAERSGAEVVTLDLLAPRIADPVPAFGRETRFTASVLERHGVPREVVVALVPLQRAHAAFGSGPVAVARTVADGDRLAFAGRTLEVLHRPGHSMTDTIFVDRQRDLAIGGDHLLGAISSNPLMGCPPERLTSGDPPTADDRVRTLPLYGRSLDATAELDPAVILAGHGGAVTDAPALVAERHRQTDRRKRKIAALLPEDRGATAFEIGTRMWGDTAVEQPLLVVSEVLGHLDLLLEDGTVAVERHDGVDRWTPTG